MEQHETNEQNKQSEPNNQYNPTGKGNKGSIIAIGICALLLGFGSGWFVSSRVSSNNDVAESELQQEHRQEQLTAHSELRQDNRDNQEYTPPPLHIHDDDCEDCDDEHHHHHHEQFDLEPYSGIPIISTIEGSTIVATVNGINITASDVHIQLHRADELLFWEYINETGNFQLDYTTPFRGQTFGEAVREEAVRLAALDLLQQYYAIQNGIVLLEDEMIDVEEELLFFENSFGVESFYNLLRAQGFSGREQFVNLLYIERLINRTFNTILEDPQLFTRFEEFMDEEIIDDSHERALIILERARAGEDFDMLIREYGADPGMQTHPEGYSFVTGVMLDSFYEATMELAIGEISGLVPSVWGYHIILRVEPDRDNVMFFDGIRPAGDEDYVLGAKHILIETPQLPTLEDRMIGAIMTGFYEMLNEATIVYLPELENIIVGNIW